LHHKSDCKELESQRIDFETKLEKAAIHSSISTSTRVVSGSDASVASVSNTSTSAIAIPTTPATPAATTSATAFAANVASSSANASSLSPSSSKNEAGIELDDDYFAKDRGAATSSLSSSPRSSATDNTEFHTPNSKDETIYCSVPDCENVATKKCQCGGVNYCSTDCQKRHWAVHKADHKIKMTDRNNSTASSAPSSRPTSNLAGDGQAVTSIAGFTDKDFHQQVPPKK